MTKHAPDQQLTERRALEKGIVSPRSSRPAIKVLAGSFLAFATCVGVGFFGLVAAIFDDYYRAHLLDSLVWALVFPLGPLGVALAARKLDRQLRGQPVTALPATAFWSFVRWLPGGGELAARKLAVVLQAPAQALPKPDEERLS